MQHVGPESLFVVLTMNGDAGQRVWARFTRTGEDSERLLVAGLGIGTGRVPVARHATTPPDLLALPDGRFHSERSLDGGKATDRSQSQADIRSGFARGTHELRKSDLTVYKTLGTCFFIFGYFKTRELNRSTRKVNRLFSL